MGLHLDLKLNFKTEGYLKATRVVEPFDLAWLEIDSYDPRALATIGMPGACRSRRANHCLGVASTGLLRSRRGGCRHRRRAVERVR